MLAWPSSGHESLRPLDFRPMGFGMKFRYASMKFRYAKPAGAKSHNWGTELLKAWIYASGSLAS